MRREHIFYFWGVRLRSLFLPIKPARPISPSKPTHSQSESLSTCVVLYILLLIPVSPGALFPDWSAPVPPVVLPFMVPGVFVPPVFPAPVSAYTVKPIVTVNTKAKIITFNFFNLINPLFLCVLTPCNIVQTHIIYSDLISLFRYRNDSSIPLSAKIKTPSVKKKG